MIMIFALYYDIKLILKKNLFGLKNQHALQAPKLLIANSNIYEVHVKCMIEMIKIIEIIDRKHKHKHKHQ